MSVSILVRLLEAAGYDLRAVKMGHVRTMDDILLEQRNREHHEVRCASFGYESRDIILGPG